MDLDCLIICFCFIRDQFYCHIFSLIFKKFIFKVYDLLRFIEALNQEYVTNIYTLTFNTVC